MAAWKRFGISGPVEVIFGSGERLQFMIEGENNEVVGIIMYGKVCHVFSGELKWVL